MRTGDGEHEQQWTICKLLFFNHIWAISRRASERGNGHGTRRTCSLLLNFAVQVPICGSDVRRFPLGFTLCRREFPMVLRSTVASEGGAPPTLRLFARCTRPSGPLLPVARAS